ncbi:helix-turn-helix domain-containing protein [Streptomyces sp. NPDC006530]|uniref:helix-turn-helix domain-containing protein n=1 Tax=Streptomyces sp. NPDC006530 TaxID=3364750 RepID=UPI0036BD2015
MTQSTADTKATDAMSPLPTPKERRRLREAKDLSEAQVATTVGVTRATVRSWETGRTTPRGRKGQIYARFLATIAAELAAAGDPDGRGEGERGDGRDGEQEPSRTPAPPRKQAANPAKPPAKPHAENTRPKPAASSATPRSSRPGGRTAKPPGTAGAPAAPAIPIAPAASHDPPAPAPSPGPAPVPLTVGASRTGEVVTEHAEAGTGEERRQDPGGRTPGGVATPPAGTPRGDDAADAEPHTTTPAETPRTEDAADAGPDAVTPAQAFDALYLSAAAALAQQTYLLTGRTRLARESVERAFHLAWEYWPQVATDRDPVGWVRAAAHEYALSPWHRFRRTHKHPDQPPVEPERRALLDTLLDLPPAYRRTALLYDGLGLDLPDAAAEMEASTPAAASRVLHARAALVDRVPAARRARTPEALSSVLRERITDLALAGPPSVTRLPAPRVVRTGGERRRRFWTRAAIAFTTLIVSATAFTVVTVPPHHVRPVPLGVRVGGVPVNSGPQRLTSEDLELRDKLRSEPARGPHRLVLDIR